MVASILFLLLAYGRTEKWSHYQCVFYKWNNGKYYNVPESRFLQPVAVINVRNRLVECKLNKGTVDVL